MIFNDRFNANFLVDSEPVGFLNRSMFGEGNDNSMKSRFFTHGIE